MKQSGQRYTTKRKEIVDAIAQFSQPIGIADLLNSVEDLPQSSLYRNLTVLQDAGVVTRVMSSQEKIKQTMSHHFSN